MRPGLQRRLATGVNAAIVAAIAVAVTGIGAELAARHRWRLDLTAEGSATLAPETRAVLDQLAATQKKAEITAFSSQARNAEAVLRDRAIRDFLRELELASPWVTTRFVDFDRDRRTAEDLGVDRYGAVVIQAAGDRVDLSDREIFRGRGPKDNRSVDFLGEGAITKGLSQILSAGSRTLYTLAGHGEKQVFDRGQGELKALSTLIETQGWKAKPLDLLRDRAEGAAPAVPGDAAAVVWIGPHGPLSSQEEEALRAYLIRGGSVALLLDPGVEAPAFLADLGVTLPEGVALDEAAIYPYQDRPLLHYEPHPVTNDLIEADLATVVASASPVAAEPRDGVTASKLLVTSRRGWIERGTERPPTYDAAVDGAGPVAVAVALDIRAPDPLASQNAERPGSRLLVVGDSDLVTDEVIGEGPGNGTFLVNALRWLVRADERMSLVGRPSGIRRVALTPDQMTGARVVVLALVPLLTLFAGLGVVWARRPR